MLHHGRRAALANSAAPPDAQFNYVTMLLHGDGTNGAQNNTFVDSSSNNFTITRNGNTTQGSFSPYGSNWSNNFNGTNSYLSFANTANLNLGSGDFTLECWICPSTASGAKIIWSQWNNGGDNATQLLQNGTALIYRIGATQWTFGSGTVAAGTWMHIAVSRSGSTVRMFVNGAVSSTQTDSTNVTTTGPTVIGCNDLASGGANFFDGYISNFRQVKGTAVYTAAFTPSTTPLTAIANTQLLVCNSNRLVDKSSNGYTPTVGGAPSVQRFNPFGTSTAYSTATIGGSGYFDGTGDYLLVPDNAALDLGSSNFTIEAWIYPTAYPGDYGAIVSKYASGFQDSFYFLFQSSGAIRFGTDSAEATTSTTLKINNWSHVAVTRSGSTFTIWINGVNAGGFTNSSAVKDATSRVCIGNMDGYSQLFTGYITDVRIVKGTAVYSTTFTPPTAPLTAITNTSLLCLMQNGAIYDNAMMNDLETVGNAQISTSVKKYGTGSMYFDGTGDYLISKAAIPRLKTSDFTIEWWEYRTSTGNDKPVMQGSGAYANNDPLFGYSGSSNNLMYLSSNGSSWDMFSGFVIGSLDLNTWNHFAVTRSGSTFRGFKNGVLTTSGTSSSSIYQSADGWAIGIGQVTSQNFQGYIDDLRITVGYARYTTTFTPPTSALADKGPI